MTTSNVERATFDRLGEAIVDTRGGCEGKVWDASCQEEAEPQPLPIVGWAAIQYSIFNIQYSSLEFNQPRAGNAGTSLVLNAIRIYTDDYRRVFASIVAPTSVYRNLRPAFIRAPR